jgi:hypothetical protein
MASTQSRSRSVRGGAARAFWMASQPRRSASGGKGGSKGFGRWLIATPHHAMAQSGSAAVIAAKAFTVAGKKAFTVAGKWKECSIATAWSNCCCACGLQETGKCTWP